MRATYISTGKDLAIKVLDKGHLQRKRKMSVALVEKQALVRLATGHPGVIRLHYTFQDEWSLCECAPPDTTPNNPLWPA
jgi:3-phosphoinositide dependent protein kinase-1